jgi:hypothetical protein
MSSSLVGVHDRLHQCITSSMDDKNDMVVNMATFLFYFILLLGEFLRRSSSLGTLRAASHYGQRSRGCWFPPIIYSTRYQEISLSTLHTRVQSPKVVALQNAYMAIFLTKAMDSRRKFESDMIGNLNYGWEAVNVFSLKIKIKIKKIKTRCWALDWRGCFGHEIKWNAPSSFEFWAWS